LHAGEKSRHAFFPSHFLLSFGWKVPDILIQLLFLISKKMDHLEPFDKDVTTLLRQVKDVDKGGFGGREFDVRPESARLAAKPGSWPFGTTPDPKKLVTEAGKNDETHRRAFLGAVIGALLERHYVWGALLNHPRTVIVGPDATFDCTNTGITGGRKLTWGDKMKAADAKKLHPRDVDQIVWLNHCAAGSGKSKPVVEIGLMRMNHEMRSELAFKLELGAVRLVSHGGDVSHFEKELGSGYKTTEALAIVDYLFDRKVHEIDVVPAIGAFVTADSPETAGDQLDYLKRCAAVLERVMRDRTSRIHDVLSFKTFGATQHVDTDLMYKAVIARQIPYAASALADPQPAVMPGETDLDEIVDVLKDVIGFGVQVKGAFANTPYDSIFDSEEPANPYDAFDDMSQDDDANFMGNGALSPFSGSEDEFEI
jgi:hypothetical protein